MTWVFSATSPVAAALVLAAPALPAQTPATTSEPPAVVVGARVRLWERAAAGLAIPIVGDLTRVTPDTVALRPDGLQSTVGVERPHVVRIELSGGPGTASRSASAWKGAAIGGLGGAILGIIAGDISRHNAARFGAYGAVGGALIGAGAGAARPGEVWHPAVLAPAVPAGK
jgi:hypothetical protein